jgi:MFS family permease
VPDRTSPLAPFRNETFRLIWAASLVSNFGGLIQAVGAAWMMASISSSANMVALVQASTSLPIMLFSVAAGALADNFDRRKLMLTAQCFMLTVAIALTLCAWYEVITPWLLLTFTFLIGCGSG